MMSLTMRKITPADILPETQYAARRTELRAASIAAKKTRRMEVGPYATLYFENYDSMWLQVHEMLRIEKGGAQQLAAARIVLRVGQDIGGRDLTFSC